MAATTDSLFKFPWVTHTLEKSQVALIMCKPELLPIRGHKWHSAVGSPAHTYGYNTIFLCELYIQLKTLTQNHSTFINIYRQVDITYLVLPCKTACQGNI